MSTTAFAKKLLFGVNASPASPADCLYVFEALKTRVKPEGFFPLIHVTGGVSLVGGGGDNRNMQALLLAGDWLSHCIDIGATPVNSIICMASNYDDHPGMVACALECASMALKPKTVPKLRLTVEGYMEVVNEVFGNNYADIWQMAEQWGIGVRRDIKFDPPKTRSFWRKELGHDVLIHPITLKPCELHDKALRYDGIVTEPNGSCKFLFITNDGKRLVQNTFPDAA